MNFSKHITAPLLLVSLTSFVGCSAEDLGAVESEENWAAEEALELASMDQAQIAACGGDDSNSLAAGLAVAIGKELGRWDVNTDFVISNGKLELSATGKLLCGSNCPRTTALLRMQDDASNGVPPP